MTQDKLKKRERQQAAIARFGRLALSGADLDSLCQAAAESGAEETGLSHAKVLELLPDGSGLLVRSGIGWDPGVVGKEIVEAGSGSQGGFTLLQSAPVIVEDFRTETRFEAPPLLSAHGILCGASVIIGPLDNPWGVLGVHDPDPGKCTFDEDDINFIEALANTLWLAIAQQRALEVAERERRELRQFIDAMPFQLSVVSNDERYLVINDAYSVWGHNLSLIEGKSVRELLGEDAYAQVKPHIDAVLRGEPQQFEVKLDMGGTSFTRLATYAPRLDGQGRPDGFYVAGVDITSQKRAEQALAERTAQYQTIGESIPYGVWICDAEGHLVYVSESFLDMVGMSRDEALKFGWTHRLAEGAEETLAAWKECVRTGSDWEHEHRFLAVDGTTRTVLALGRPIRDAEGRVLSWSGLNLDITERKREEERAQVITAELDHRVKNILATVSSIARLSGRNAKGLDDYRENFEARIQALSRAHQTLAASRWDGLPMRQQVEDELSPYLGSDSNQITIDGPAVLLTPAAAQAMSLAVHELATNALKYGALSKDGGHLAVSWEFASGEGGEALRFRWLETGLSGVSPPDRRGFGTTVLRDVVPAQCDASVTLDFRDSGLDYQLVLPPATLRRN